MPPTQHSNSTAHKESDGLQPNGLYKLGEYTFRLERSSVPGSSNDQITAVCMQGGKNARKSIQISSSTLLDGWYVEANDTTADVYAKIKKPKGGNGHTSDLDTGWAQPIITGAVGTYTDMGGQRTLTEARYSNCAVGVKYGSHGSNMYQIIASTSQETVGYGYRENSKTEGHRELFIYLSNSFSHNGKTVYYNTVGSSLGADYQFKNANLADSFGNVAQIAWTMVYGDASGGDDYDLEDMLIARFAIDLEDAGGNGPESDWIDPGDYDEDWEEGDPTQTLYVTVTGALSGRHNDPIVDPSYSYIPADKDTVKDYGFGGDGGHGGGGGAGASTVVVHKFATNQADGKEVTAIARRHGYGSGGGKGGKGGDGCILIYY